MSFIFYLFLGSSVNFDYSIMQVSWCKFEVVVKSAKDIQVSNCPKKTAEAPPVVVTAISLKTINFDEIVSASVICCHKAKVCPTIFLALLVLVLFFL